MIEHVWRRAKLALPHADIFIIASEDSIVDALSYLPANFQVSERSHVSGTSRVSEFISKYSDYDFAIVLQGDEVLLEPITLRSLFYSMSNSEISAMNVVSPLTDSHQLDDESIVKCYILRNSTIGYIFRKNPLIGNLTEIPDQIRIIRGLFALSRDVLSTLSMCASQSLASSQSIEQLSFLEMGFSLASQLEENYYPSVNTQYDLEEVEALLLSDTHQQSLFASIFPS